MTITIGFETLRGAGTSWRAGSVYFADLLRALRATYSNRIRLLLVDAHHGTPTPQELVPLTDGVIAYPHLKRGSVTWALNHAQHRLFQRALLPDRVLKQQGLDVLLTGVLERQTTLPTFALLADFQHLHLPELFRASEIAWRNAEYLKTAERATRVLLFSKAVRADFEKFAPNVASKARVLAPVSYVPDEIYARDPKEILQTYALPEKFVYLPNQFWQHKNHLRAFDALRHVRARGENIFVVCTGATEDHRNPAYFSEILQMLARWGLREQVVLLGSVPRDDVFALMRQAAFVWNPSRFEGFGLSLAEARAIGKRALVSDLPAHREQDAPCVTYFDPNDAQDLTEKLAGLWRASTAGPDAALETAARRAQPARVRAYAETLMQLLGEVHDPRAG